jgi:putative chitinase
MKFQFKEEHLARMIPSNKNVSSWYKAIIEVFPKYDIDTPQRVAGFIAQCAHESGEFRTLEENLNYSPEQLLKVFPRYFGAGKRDPNAYARNPEKLANYVYMDEFRSKTGQMGNTQPGDGYRFRGRGLKQLTGRNNYTAFGKTVGMTAEQAAEYVVTEKGAIESACWFWDTKKLNAVADAGDIVKMTKIINGGNIGLADRTRRWEAALKILNTNVNSTVQEATVTSAIVKRGSRGELVKKVQTALGLKADGVFGIATEVALKSWQAKVGLVADGVAGPKTLEKLLR